MNRRRVASQENSLYYAEAEQEKSQQHLESPDRGKVSRLNLGLIRSFLDKKSSKTGSVLSTIFKKDYSTPKHQTKKTFKNFEETIARCEQLYTQD